MKALQLSTRTRKQIAELPSAQAFLRRFSGGNAALLFSGEGESLVLAAWLQAVGGIATTGVFVRQYGQKVRFGPVGKWCEHYRIRQSFKRLCPNRDFVILREELSDGSKSECFVHGFECRWDKSYPENREVKCKYSLEYAEMLIHHGFSKAIMGVRSDDVFHYLVGQFDDHPGIVRDIQRFISKEISQNGHVPLREFTNLITVWWPFFDMSRKLKEQALKDLGYFC